MSITVNGTTGLNFPDGTSQPTAGFVPFRNRIINGDMRIDQRYAGAALTITGTDVNQYVLDRFYIRAASATGSKVRAQRSTVAPAGFVNSELITSLSAYTLGASEHFGTTQAIEGFNIADLGWGTVNAQPVTISFWVRSSLTGTFGGHITNADSSTTYVYSYTINAANTWEYKTITVAGPTTGTWQTGNAVGLYLNFSVAAGSSVTRAAGSWGTFARSVTGQTSLVGTNAATFNITGVQFERGTAATAFELRPYPTEFSMCQRYFQTSYWSTAVGTANSDGPMFRYLDGAHYYPNFPVMLKVPMRVAPSCALWTPNGVSGKIQTDGTQTNASIAPLGNHSILASVVNILVGQSVSFAFHYTAESEF
jgi:hypothetical protein